MTSTKYYVFRLAQIFGYSRKNIRMSDAASESHLLKEAEAHLGQRLWKNVEHIEALSVEYWNLRKLDKERKEIAAEFDSCQKDLDSAHEERAKLLGVNEEHFQDLISEKNEVLDSTEVLVRKRDAIVAKAREIKRSYEGVKMKQEVLHRDDHQDFDGMEATVNRLKELKAEFESLKNQRKELADSIEEGEVRINEIESEISERKTERREKAANEFQHIGEGNQTMSILRSKLGVMDTQMRQLHTEIGRYVSRNHQHDPACRKACGKSRGLVDVMAALRKSIQYNHQLAEMS